MFKRLWTKFKAPIVFIASALAALVLVVVDAMRLGRRLEARKQLKKETQDALDEIDKMAAHGDTKGLRDDILKRVK